MLEEEYKTQVDDMLKVELDNMRLLSGVKAKKKKGKKKKKKGKKKKGGGHPPCGTSGKKSGYAKCVPASKAKSMSKKEKESATRRKRAAQNKANRGGSQSRGQGKKPINVSTHTKGRKSGTRKGS